MLDHSLSERLTSAEYLDAGKGAAAILLLICGSVASAPLSGVRTFASVAYNRPFTSASASTAHA